MSKYTISRSLPEDDWRSFVNEHPDGNIFQTPEMFQVFLQTKLHQPELWGVVDNGTVLALLLPVRIVLLSNLTRLLTTRAISYGSILYTNRPAGVEALEYLLKTYSRRAPFPILFTELRHLTNQDNVQGIFADSGYKFEENLNYLVNLNLPAEEVFKNIGSRTRKGIRNGLNKGKVKITEITERDKLSVVYSLLQKTYKAAKVPLADISLFESAYDVLYPKGMIRFTIASVDDVPASVSVDLIYKKTIYGWFGGTDRNYSSFVSNELLTWHLLEWGANLGYHVYDFGGAGKPEEEYGVRTFKSKFGGTLVNYGRNTFFHSPVIFKISEAGYQLTRKLFFGGG